LGGVCGARRGMCSGSGGVNKRLDEVVKLGIPKQLEDLVKLDLLEEESPGRVLQIWMEYHKDKDGAVAGVMSGPEYDTFKFRSSKAPMCLIPVFKGDGHFVVIAQAQSPEAQLGGSDAFLVAHLDDYRANPTLAQPYLSLTVYTETLKSKELALVRGEYDKGRLSKEEASLVVSDVIRSYVNTEFFKHVNTLNNRPAEFDWGKEVALFEEQRKQEPIKVTADEALKEGGVKAK